MKQSLLILSVALFAISCSKKSVEAIEMTPETQQILDAGSFLDEWHASAGEANFDQYFDAMADDGIYVGTDEKEVWTKEEFKEFSRPFFEKGRAWDFTSIERNIYVSEDKQFMWFNETLDTWMGICRGSGVIKITGTEPNTYEIKHYVLSLTIPNEQMQDVIELLEKETED